MYDLCTFTWFHKNSVLCMMVTYVAGTLTVDCCIVPSYFTDDSYIIESMVSAMTVIAQMDFIRPLHVGLNHMPHTETPTLSLKPVSDKPMFKWRCHKGMDNAISARSCTKLCGVCPSLLLCRLDHFCIESRSSGQMQILTIGASYR